MNRRFILCAAVVALSACTQGGDGTSTSTTIPVPDTSTTSTPDTTVTAAATTTTTVATTTTTVSPFARPDWLGTRPLPLREDGFGEILPTPPEMVDRRFETIDTLPPPPDDEFVFTAGPVPDDVLARSTWTDACPVGVDDLTYLTLAHWGFDGKVHTGELIVNATAADDIVGVFEQLHAARFPIEQMGVVTLEELDAHPTGDWNMTTSFVCRPAVGSGSWSQHAFGLAIDINPFHNPYLKGDLVLPELASAYLDRTDERPGMILEGDVVVQAFAEIGWPWGGNWNTLADWMHFSRSGR